MKITVKKYIEELLFSFTILKHPFGGFWDMKREKKGTLRASLTILFLTLATTFIQERFTGFLFNENYFKPVNLALTSLPLLVLFLLWCISNYCLTTLMDGEGSFKDIVMASGYALTPYPLLMIPYVLLSNIFVFDEASFLTTIESVAVIWIAFLLVTGTLEIHQYTMRKNILTVIFTIIGIAIMIFLGLLLFSLADQIISFVENLVEEITLRLRQ